MRGFGLFCCFTILQHRVCTTVSVKPYTPSRTQIYVKECEQPNPIGGCPMTTKEQRRQEWTARIADYKASGLTMSA